MQLMSGTPGARRLARMALHGAGKSMGVAAGRRRIVLT